MQNNSINRLTLDWTAICAQAFEAAGAAQTIPDTYPGTDRARTDRGRSQLVSRR